MYCQNCGSKIDQSAIFCPTCGNKIKEEISNIKDDKSPIFTLKPQLNLLYLIGVSLVKTLIPAFFLYIFYDMLNPDHYGKSFPLLTVYLILSLFYLIIELLRHRYTEYCFYCTKLEYTNSFLGSMKKEIKYSSVIEVTMKQGIIEKICNIGTIKIATNATNNNNGSPSQNGLYIHCISNIEETYQTINELFHK